MSTSLAEQLKRLALPQTTILTRDKKRPSLLFDPKEAANLSRETVYQIGIDGLEELISRDPAFRQFENSLFDITSKDFERSVQTAEANQKLDKNVKKFLLLLSPYFLFNCSYKALEWLVHRFHIQDYNKEDLLMLILPYHETNIFVRTLQLLNLKDQNDKWHWLRRLQKRGIHLPKQTLYNHAASDPYFIKFVSTYMFSIIKEHDDPKTLTVSFNFYCTTFTGALEFSENVNEAHISQMLPILLQGLSSTIPDFVASSYIICGRLVTKTQLADKVLEKFVEKISKISVTNLKTEAVLALIILYQSQKQYREMTVLSFKRLCAIEGIVKILEKFINDGIHMYPVLRPLIWTGVHSVVNNEDNEEFKKFLDTILDEIVFEDMFVEILINCILEIVEPETEYPEDTIKWLKHFISKIERRHPAAFDKMIKNLMKRTDDPTRQHNQTVFHKLIGDITNFQESYELFEKLYHPIPQIRIKGLQILVQKLKLFEGKDAEMFQSAIFDRINDDSIIVVQETLQLFKMHFPKIIDMDVLKNALIKLTIKGRNQEEWISASYIAIQTLCHHYTDSDVKVFVTVLPFLLPVSARDFKTAKKIILSNYGKKSKWLASLLKELNDCKNSDAFAKTIYKNIGENHNLVDIKSVVEALKDMTEYNSNVLNKCLAMMLLCNSLPQNADVGISGLVLDIFEMYLNTTKITVIKGKFKSSNYVSLARNNKFTLQSFLYCIEKLINKTQKSDKRLGLLDFSLENDFSKFYVRLLKLLMQGSQSSKHIKSLTYFGTLEVLLKRFCGMDIVYYIEFLLNVVIGDNLFIDNELRLCSLQTVILLLTKNDNNVIDANKVESLIIPYVLIGLNLPNSEMRQILINIIIYFCKRLNDHKSKMPQMLKKLLEYQEEILLDHTQIPLIMFNVLSSNEKNFKGILKVLVDLTNDNRYPIYFKSGLLQLLVHINNIEIYTSTATLAVELLKKVAGTSAELSIFESEIVYKNIKRFNSSIVEAVKENGVIWELITLSIKNDTSLVKHESSKMCCPAVLLLNQIDRNTFSKLKPPVQEALLNLIIEIATNTKNPEVLQAVGQVFKKIDLDTSLVLNQLQGMRDVRSPKENPAKRKRRIGIIPTVDILDTNDWKKGITVMEFIQDKKKIRNTNVLLPLLFEILKKCLDFDEQANVEYPKQLVLSTILHCCDKIINEPLPENAFNMQLVVQCIRASQNPQTHHHALLLLAQAAALVPKQVLHHIIAIFTFMGSSVLRHDDAYSFQIISKITDTVIPILIKDGNVESIAKVLRVFVDAILDVPEHRRVVLFKQLLTRLDPNENLHLFLAIIFEAHVVHAHTEKQKTNKNRSLLNIDESPKRLDIAANLIREFTPIVVINNIIKVLQYLCALPEETSSETQNLDNYRFDVKRYTAKQFRHYKYVIVVFVANFLSSEQFVMQVAALSDDEMQKLEGPFKELIIAILNYIQTISKVTENNANTPQSQYWKTILHYSYDILDAINALLTNQMFLLVIRGLMVYSLSTVRKRALDLLNNKLQHNTSLINNCEKDQLHNLIVVPLLNIIKTISNPEIEPDQEQIVQKALVSLKLFVKYLAREDPQTFVPILEFTANLIKTDVGRINENVLSSLILCIAELCNNLRAHAIASLNKFMPVILKLLKSHKHRDTPSLLLISNITAIHKILDSLPLFLSPYLEKLLKEISVLSSKWDIDDGDQKLVLFKTKLRSIQQKIGSIIPLRVLLPAIENSYNNLLIKNNFTAIEPLMIILADSLSNLKGNDIHGHLPDLTNFFLNALQFRGVSQCIQADQVEDHVIKAFVTLILKLSESSFRPLYYKIFDWAVRTDVKSERIITFYKLSGAFANHLKSLFVLFAGHFLNNAATLLDACNKVKNKDLYFEDDDKNVILLVNILNTLQFIFLHDSQKFVTKERFEVLMQPIVDQLENDLKGMESLKERAKTIVTPCIVQFAVATADDALWKQMNYQILLKTRHNSPDVRLVALESFGETAKKLGDDFLPLLPETIPFLAELMEDEEEEIEKVCKKTVQELEKVLGEPLQKYF